MIFFPFYQKGFDFLYFQSSYFVEEDGKEYIYKEPKVTSLAEICERLKNMYSEKYGKDTVKLIMDSNKVLKPGLHVCILTGLSLKIEVEGRYKKVELLLKAI